MFKQRIRERYETLTPSFREIADFVVDHTLEVAFLTSTGVADRVGVDAATVVRFAQELGYSGSRELLSEIKTYVHDQITATHQRVGEADSIGEQMHRLAQSVLQDLQGFAATEIAGFEEPVELLSQASRIWITGEYMTYDIAVFMQKALELVGIRSTAFAPDKGSTANVLSRMCQGDVLLSLVSIDPGVDAGYVMQKAREKGVRTIAISGSSVVLAAREADISATIPIRTTEGIPSFAFLFLVVALIWETLARQRAADSAKSLIRFREQLEFVLA